MCKKVVIIGAGGHAKVVADIIEKSGDIVHGFLDDNLEIGTTIANIKQFKVIGKISDCTKIQQNNTEIQFIVAIGNNEIRRKIGEEYKLNYYIAIHPTATIALDICIGEGTVIMANACINTSARIGKHSIINTGSIVEHDNIIENYVHISPRVALGGTVRVGKCTHVGIGATVKNNVTICENCIIGAGAVVVKNIEKKGTYIGVPAKENNFEKSVICSNCN